MPTPRIPWNHLEGKPAPLEPSGISPHCAMMQVAAEDTHDNYVICRGYDPRIKKFFDYVEGDPDKVGVPVAKPWSNRTAGAYTVGQIFPAMIPLTRIGQTPGVRDPGEDEEDPLLGQPADLDEEVGILYTEDGKVINWLLLEAEIHRRFELKDNLTDDNTAATEYELFYDDTFDQYSIGTEGNRTEFELYSFTGWRGTAREEGPPVVDGSRGWCVKKDGRREVVAGDVGFDRCTCQLTGALATGDGSILVDNVKRSRGPSPLADPDDTTETLLVYNPHSWDGDDDASCVIVWNITTAHWEFDYIPCPA